MPEDPSNDRTGFLEKVIAEQRIPLTRYAARLLGDADRARDVVQDTFLRFMAQPPTIDGHPVEWLFTVCRHRALDVRRKEGPMRRFGSMEAEGIHAPDPRPGEALEAAETRHQLLQLIDRLPETQQEVVRLKFQQGFSYKEIARITDLSVGNVGFLIHAAVTRLRREWGTAAMS